MMFYMDFVELAHEVDTGMVRRRNLSSRVYNDAFDLTDRQFIKTYRLSKDLARALIDEISPHMPINLRSDGIDTKTKILVALAFYASGSYQTLVGQSQCHAVSQPSVSRALKQVTEVLNKPHIFKKYVKFPSSREDRDEIKRGFYRKFGMSGVLGCIDGTHVAIVPPAIHEERYFNRKGYHSLNTLIICDSDARILCVDPSNPGSTHDSAAWNNNPLKSILDELISSTGEDFYLLGDSGFPLRRAMMTPILNASPNSPEAHYTEMHMTTRNVVERCIGILKARFSIKKEVEDPPPSPDSSQADHGVWHVPVKQEVEDVHPENFLQVDIGTEQWSEKDDELFKGHASGDSAGPPDSSNEAELDKTSPGNFVCDICKKSFVNSGNLKRHLQLHSKKSFKCQQCDKSFLTEIRLNSHVYNRHTDKSERVFNCDECPKTFKTSSNLQQHKKTHLIHKPFECTKCSQTFAFKINYLKHQKKPCPITPPKKPIVCTICNKVFEKEFLLKSHLRRHDNDRPFGCEECTMVFKHKSTLMRHMHVHTGVRPYPCPYCDKTFTSSGLLKPHLRVHTGEKPYKCEVCPKMFAHKHNMQRHMVGHEKVKHTVCDICHKEFPRESRLRYHMKTHVNEKFFRCKVCPKRFSHKQNVIRHYARKHPGKTYSCEETDASVAAKVWDTVKHRLNDDEAEEILGLD